MNEQKLIESLSSERSPHAILLCGAAGAGKRELARRLAAAHILGAPDERLLVNNPNYMELGELPIRVEEVRALTASANMAGFDGGKRAFCLIDAHRMSPQAQNALLKTLEEPPSGALFLLTGTELGLLATIRSRCAIVRLGAQPETALAEALISRGVAEADAHLAASLSGGVPGLARLYATEAYQAFRKEGLDCLEQALFGAPPFAEAAKLSGSGLFLKKGMEAKKSDGEAAKYLLLLFETVLRDALFLKLNVRLPSQSDLGPLPVKIAHRFTISAIQGMITQMGKAVEKLFYRANPVFTLDAALICLSEYKEKHA